MTKDEPLYGDRDAEAQGDHYTRHVAAMTEEGLHSKSDIAAELAHRDILIEQLRATRPSGGLDAAVEVVINHVLAAQRMCDALRNGDGQVWDAADDARLALESVLEDLRALPPDNSGELREAAARLIGGPRETLTPEMILREAAARLIGGPRETLTPEMILRGDYYVTVPATEFEALRKALATTQEGKASG